MRAFLLLVACFQSEAPGEVQGTEPDGDPRTAAQEVPDEGASGFRLVVPAERSAAHASARCNDGTAAGFSLRRTDSDTWVVRVDGGFFCDDVRTPCSGRARRLTTARRGPGGPLQDGAEVSVPALGLFATDPVKNPLFHEANHAALHYCSSDLWLGDGAARQATTGSEEGWWFAGRSILEADLKTLVGLGMDPTDPDTRILIVGHSAGGMGVVGNLGLLTEVLGPAVQAGRVHVVLDGAWVPPQPLATTPKANRWGPLLPECEARMASSGRDPLACVFGSEWYPHWAESGIPVLVQQSGLDTTQLKAYAVPRDGLHAWRAGARDSLTDVAWLFSGGHRYHTVTFQDRLSVGPPSDPFSKLLRDFWAGEEPRRTVFRYAESAQE